MYGQGGCYDAGVGEGLMIKGTLDVFILILFLGEKPGRLKKPPRFRARLSTRFRYSVFDIWCWMLDLIIQVLDFQFFRAKIQRLSSKYPVVWPFPLLLRICPPPQEWDKLRAWNTLEWN